MHSIMKSTVIDVSGQSKIAALFFDYVVPVFLSKNEREVDVEVLDANIIRQLIPPQLWNSSKEDVIAPYLEVLKQWLILAMDLDQHVATRRVKKFEKLADKFWVDTYSFLASYGFGSAPMLWGDSQPETGSLSEKIVVTVSGANLIDIGNASWRQVMEFRNDSDSISKLRRLRLFLTDTYTGKSPSYVIDDLYKRLEDHERTAKAWGFETLTSSLSLVLSSKTLLASSTGTLASILLGQPVAAVISAAAGGVVEMGNVALHLAKRQYGFESLKRDHPLAYIVKARESFVTAETESIHVCTGSNFPGVA